MWSAQGCFTHKEGTSEQDGEVNREIDGHHLLGPCIICHCHCCQNTDCCFSPLNVIANDVGCVPNATNVLFLWGLVSCPGQLCACVKTGDWLIKKTDMWEESLLVISIKLQPSTAHCFWCIAQVLAKVHIIAFISLRVRIYIGGEQNAACKKKMTE